MPYVSWNQHAPWELSADARRHADTREHDWLSQSDLLASVTGQGIACSAEGSSAGKDIGGAWMLMVEVSVQEPAAPSWEFLQV